MIGAGGWRAGDDRHFFSAIFAPRRRWPTAIARYNFGLGMRLLLCALLSSGCAALLVSSVLRRGRCGGVAHGVALRGGAVFATVVDPNPEPFMRVGHGYDIHRMASREEAGQPLVISGVLFDGSDAPDFELGCVAHSDGDVVYHSVVDAILGALSMPDIGQLFPDNDPRLRGANSEIFMEEAYLRMVRHSPKGQALLSHGPPHSVTLLRWLAHWRVPCT